MVILRLIYLKGLLFSTVLLLVNNAVLYFPVYERNHTLNPLPVSSHKFIVIAHRADHKTAPENSLEAIDSAIAHGADYVELDLRTSFDSSLYIMHDATIQRTTNCEGEISKLDKRVLDTCHLKNSNETIPGYEACLKRCKGKINLYLDFKNADVRTTYALLKKYNFTHSAIVYINSLSQYSEWRKWAPKIPLIISHPGNITSLKDLKYFLLKYPTEVLDGNYTDYSPEMVKLANSMGIVVWPDIQNISEMSNWPEAIKLGISGLQTDHPQLLIEWLTKQNLR